MYPKFLKFLLFILLPVAAFASSWSNWSEVHLGNGFNGYSNVVAKDESHAYVVLGDSTSAKAALYLVNLSANESIGLTQIGPKFAIAYVGAKTSLALDDAGIPYIAYATHDNTISYMPLNINVMYLNGNNWNGLGRSVLVDLEGLDQKLNDFKIIHTKNDNQFYVAYSVQGGMAADVLHIKYKDNSGWWLDFSQEIAWMLGNLDVAINNNIDTLVISRLNTNYQPEVYMGARNNNIFMCNGSYNDSPPCQATRNIDRASIDISSYNVPLLTYLGPSTEVVATYFTDNWHLVKMNGAASNYAWSPQMYFENSSSNSVTTNDIVYSYIGRDNNDTGYNNHYFTQVYNVATNKWSSPMKEPTNIRRNFDVNYGYTYYDKAFNKIFAVVEDGLELILAEQHMLQPSGKYY